MEKIGWLKRDTKYTLFFKIFLVLVFSLLLGKLDSYMQKNQTGLLSYIVYKNKLKTG